MKTKILTIALVIILIGTIFTSYLFAETYETNAVEKNIQYKNTIKYTKLNSNLAYSFGSIQKTLQLPDDDFYTKTIASKELSKKDEVKKQESTKKEEKKTSKSISEKEKTALLKIVEAEATDEDIKGRVLIANVVFNRVKSKNFPDTVYDVIHQRIRGRAQFSPIDDGRYNTVTISENTKKAVELALDGEDYSKGALYFVAPTMTSKKSLAWFENNLTKVLEYGVHNFYK